MALIAGYITYGTGTTPQNFTEISGITRIAATFSGGVAGGPLSCASGTAPASAGSYNSVAVFDAATGGNMTLYSSLGQTINYAASATIAAYSQPVNFNDGLLTSLNTPGEVFAQGFDFGTLGAQALLAGTSLELSGAGTLIAGSGTMYVPSCTGAPTDTPISVNGLVPFRIDNTNNKIWAYSGGTWKGVTIA